MAYTGEKNTEYQRDWRKAHPGYTYRITKQKRTAFRKFLHRWKLSAGCFDCGYNTNAEALHFDHIEGKKTRNVSDMATYSIRAIIEELDKCVVRCANCHAVMTANRRI